MEGLDGHTRDSARPACPPPPTLDGPWVFTDALRFPVAWLFVQRDHSPWGTRSLRERGPAWSGPEAGSSCSWPGRPGAGGSAPTPASSRPRQRCFPQSRRSAPQGLHCHYRPLCSCPWSPGGSGLCPPLGAEPGFVPPAPCRGLGGASELRWLFPEGSTRRPNYQLIPQRGPGSLDCGVCPAPPAWPHQAGAWGFRLHGQRLCAAGWPVQ